MRTRPLFLVLLVVGSSFLGACAARHVRQPRMQHARQELEAALNALEGATADKGGHRVQAMEQVRAAITEVDEGIRFDDTH